MLSPSEDLKYEKKFFNFFFKKGRNTRNLSVYALNKEWSCENTTGIRASTNNPIMVASDLNF